MSRKSSKFSINNLSYKTLLIILLFLLISIVVLLKFVLPKKASAAWWNDGWNYRKAVSISNTSGSDLNNFQVSLSIGTSALIAAGKMKSDCSDIRFTDQNGNLLPYWIEENNPGCNQLTDTKIWIKTSSIPISGSTIFIYYGNTSASSTQNGNNTFEFFDDFNSGTNGNNLDTVKWPAQTSGWKYYTDGTNKVVRYEGGSSTSIARAISYKQITSPLVYEAQMKSETGKDAYLLYNIQSQETTSAFGNLYLNGWGSSGSRIILYKDSAELNGLGSVNVPTTYTNIKVVNTNNIDTFYYNNVGSTLITTDSTYQSGYVGIGAWNGSFTGSYWNYVFVRKYASVDPTTTLQSEEVGGGPVAYWKFDEGVGTTVYDSTLNLHNGVLAPGSSAPTWQTTDKCISGKCLNFDGLTNYIDTNYVYNMSYNTSTTFSFWFKPSNNNTGGYIKDIIAKNNFEFLIGQIDQHLSFQQWNASGTNLISLNSTNFIQANQWYYITVISDNSDHKAKIFINGKADNTSNITNDIFINRSESIKIGRGYGWGSSTTPFFNGLIDDVKIYPYARTATQIKLDYNSRGSLKGTTANLSSQSTAHDLSSNLVAYYKFDEGNGSTVYNSGNGGTSLNGTFGTGNSAPAWSTNGKYNKSLNFNGSNSYITMPNSVSLWPAKVSMFAWVYPKAATNGTDYVIKDDNSYFLLLTGDGSQLTVQTNLYISGGWRGRWISTGKINPNTWSYVGFTYDGTNINLYINGVLSGSYIPSPTGDLNTGALGNLIIGKRGGGSFFNGLIDEVKIYNTALTPDEIKMDYNHGSATNFGTTNQTISGTTTDLNYCIPGDTSFCASPIAEWKMDEKIGTSIIDTSGNNNTGIFGAGNSAPSWTQGKIGSGLNFDGISNYLSIGVTPVPINYTISAWINLTTLGREQHFAEFNGTQFYVSSSNKLGTSSWSNASGTTTLAANKWYYAVLTRNSSEVRLYLNGILEGVGTSGADPSSPFIIGDLFSHSGNYKFSGKIDQVRIYNYARTPAQVAYDYNKGGPVAWWKFDECQGNTAYDWSGNNNNGTINIGSSGSQNSVGNCSDGLSTSAWNNGKTGHTNSSLNFDGNDDYVNGGNLGALTPQGTISFWMKPAVVENYRNPFSTKYLGSNSCIRFEEYTTPSPYGGFAVMVGNDSGSFTPHEYLTSTILNINTWYHVVLTWNTNTNIVTGYLDGQQKFNEAHTLWPTTLPSITIGGGFNATRYWNGQIDDVRIYNYALTAEQVKQIYNGGAINFN